MYKHCKDFLNAMNMKTNVSEYNLDELVILVIKKIYGYEYDIKKMLFKLKNNTEVHYTEILDINKEADLCKVVSIMIDRGWKFYYSTSENSNEIVYTMKLFDANKKIIAKSYGVSEYDEEAFFRALAHACLGGDPVYSE